MLGDGANMQPAVTTHLPSTLFCPPPDTMPHPLPPCVSVYAPNRRLPLASRPELGDGGNMRPVVDLLVEQIECADFILLNKV